MSLKSSPFFLGLILSGFYVLTAGAYIIISSKMVADAYGEAEAMTAEITKGLAFVVITGVSLFFLSYFCMRVIAKQSRKIERQQQSILTLDRRAQEGLLASAIGHDANNLLAAITMSVEMLECGVDPERHKIIVTKLSKVLEELRLLNNRLVRGGQANQPGEMVARNVHHESERVMNFLEANHPISRLNLEFTTEGEVTACINRHLYYQVMLNLLNNCARHAGERARVCVHTEDCGDHVCVSIDDDGPGVPEDLRENIFEAYVTNHPDGSGVGLASVRTIVRMHNGEIKCKASDELGGAKFQMFFPRKHGANNGGGDCCQVDPNQPTEPQLVGSGS